MEAFQYLDIIQKKLENSFNISRNVSINNFTYDLFAEYHLRNEKYLMVKKAVVYAFENNEYCLIKYYKKFNADDYNIFTDSLINSTEKIVNPSKEHMSSIITGVIITEEIQDEDLENIRKKN